MSGHITVTGSGTSKTRCERTRIDVLLNTQTADYQQLQERAAAAAAQLTAALCECGFVRGDIETDAYSVVALYDYPPQAAAVLRGYSCEQRLTFGFDNDPQRLSRVLAALSDSECRAQFEVSFTNDDINAAECAALSAAVADAAAKAAAVAAAAGCKLGEVDFIECDEAGAVPAPLNYRMCATQTAGMSSDIEPRAQTIVRSVRVRYFTSR